MIHATGQSIKYQYEYSVVYAGQLKLLWNVYRTLCALC